MKLFRKIREKQGLNQYQMAKLSGLKQNQYAALERNEGKNYRNLIKIWIASGLSADLFLRELADELGIEI